MVLLQVVESDALLRDRDTLAAVLAANTEATFTGYVRKFPSVAGSTVDDATDRREADMPDQVWGSAGGAVNNALVKLLVCYDPDTTSGDDSAIVPLTAHDFVTTTTGVDLTAEVAAAGYFRAA